MWGLKLLAGSQEVDPGEEGTEGDQLKPRVHENAVYP